MNAAFLLLTTACLAAGQVSPGPGETLRGGCGETDCVCADPSEGAIFGRHLHSQLRGLFAHERSGRCLLAGGRFQCLPSDTPGRVRGRHAVFGWPAGRCELLRGHLRDVFGSWDDQRDQRRETFHYMFDAPPDRREQRRDVLRFIFGPSPG